MSKRLYFLYLSVICSQLLSATQKIDDIDLKITSASKVKQNQRVDLKRKCPPQKQSQVQITFDLTTKNIANTDAQCFVFFVKKGFSFSPYLQKLAATFFPQLQAYMKEKKFIGKNKTSLFVPISTKKGIKRLLFLGLGEPKDGKIDIERLRQATGTLIRLAQKNKFSHIAIVSPDAQLFGVAPDYVAKQLVITLYMAVYQFNEFITTKDRRLNSTCKITLGISKKDKKAIKKILPEGAYIGRAVNRARYWVDLPASHLTPIRLTNDAKAIAKKHGFTITVFDRKKIVELGMGGLAAVSQGNQDCRFVVMEYKTKKKKADTIAFVGKGITFDSGGLSIKSSKGMSTMKDDMGGAASVIAAMDALGYLKPAVNIVCITPLTENMLSASAIKPGDIVTFYNCKTAEIKNTDAEGRMVLADGLSYAERHYKPNAMIDLATLTGSCSRALGPFYSGLFSTNKSFREKTKKASKISGDRVWRLPMNDCYKAAIKSNIADIQNIGKPKYKAGATTAALFLQNFVGKTPWVHLDIAGTAYNVPDVSYYRTDSATGVGVRLLVELAMNWS